MNRSLDWIDVAKVLIVLVTVPFLWLNVWAYLPYHIESVRHFFAIPFDEIADVMFSHRFVTVVSTDLMLGWALTSIIIAMFERRMGRSWGRVLLWIVPYNLGIGNALFSLYLLLYLRPMRDQLMRA